MDYKEYQKESARTFSYRKEALDTVSTDETHCVIGMVTESAELADAYKKFIFYGKPLDEVNVKEELGDLMWYIANLCRLKGFDLEEIMQTNINKLRVRYPDKFINELALERNLENERKELEK
jgi:NTP pyrophosphatase (non-canonical NTP hydrolase)